MKRDYKLPTNQVESYSQKFQSTGSGPSLEQQFQEELTPTIPNILSLKAVEVAELGQIKVNGVVGQNIFEAAKECVFIVNLLGVAVQLYWNGKYIDIYKGTTIAQIIEQTK